MFRGHEFAEHLGYPLGVAQVNCSVTRQGVIRGIHFADVPPGQAKYVCCVSGAILDHVEDGAADAADIFRLSRRHIGEMDSANYALAGDRTVNLRYPERIPKVFGKLMAAKHFEKTAAFVFPDLRSVNPGTADVKLRPQDCPLSSVSCLLRGVARCGSQGSGRSVDTLWPTR